MKKTLFIAILTTFVFSACTSGSKPDAVENNIKQTAGVVSENQTILNQKSKEQHAGDHNKDESFRGKTRLELDKMGLFYCAGSIIESKGKETNYAVSKVAKTQKECMVGAGSILLEKRVGKEGDKVLFEVVDEINVQSNYPIANYYWQTCKIKGKEGAALYVLHYKDQEQAENTEIEIKELWAIDLTAGKFKKIKSTDGFTCYDPYAEEF